MTMANTLKDYVALVVDLPASHALRHATSDATHTLYIRPHTPKLPTPTSSRSLFLVNVPVDATAAHLKLLLASPVLVASTSDSSLPKVSHVTFEDTPPARKSSRNAANKKRKRGADEGDDPLALTLPPTFTRPLHAPGGTAIVVYATERDSQTAYRAFQRAARRGATPHWPAQTSLPPNLPDLGSARYKAHIGATYPSHTMLQDLVDGYMSSLDAHETALARAATRARAVPDADGFITVTRGSRTGPARQTEAEEALAAQRAKEEKKRKDMGGDFYRFQVREKRKQRERELQEQFQSDVQRMKDLR
ncbi:hypothetical protein FH972_025229 [Carpinus fangiana]|uniref:Ribosomal RNA-processing protein 7 C-terminal domain-containing protein n=1 Tax=Carpinus fangiana TaxID=176857 RepID=A0A5N6L0T1_9ROSI|nr:hypothetical protein FH972_025229 [Carpinus fangiana]